MAKTTAEELDEEAQPNRWPVAIAVSVLIHVIVICEIAVAVWPTRSPLPPLVPIAERPNKTPLPEPVRFATPEPPPVPLSNKVVESGTPPVEAQTAAVTTPTATNLPRRNAGASKRPSGADQPAMVSHVVPRSSPTARTTVRRAEEATPAFDSVGEWFRAMSRMRHGDFAPNRTN